jgi:hypothetical protein
VATCQAQKTAKSRANPGSPGFRWREHPFQPLFQDVLALCENGNEEIAYNMLWSGRSYDAEEARQARAAKERYLKAA